MFHLQRFYNKSKSKFAVSAISLCTTVITTTAVASGEWPLYSADYNNSNFNASERALSADNVMYLRRAWETFNDDTDTSESPPTGFILESVLGLFYERAVTGVVASPIIRDGVLYCVDALGTVFARDPKTGLRTDPQRHWTTPMVDPDFASGQPPVLPELVYTAPIVTDTHVFVLGSSYGQLHVLDRNGGAEIDFDPSTPEVDPYRLVPDLPFSSILGDAVVIPNGKQQILVVGINIILNDALVQGAEGGMQVGLDVTNPAQPVELWRLSTLETNPANNLKFGSGVSAGSGLAVDFDRQLIIGGTGQNTSSPYDGYPDAPAPDGFIDRSDSMYAIDYLTGEFVWHNQFHHGDVFNLNDPVSTGPNQPDGPRDADVLSPPILFSINDHYGKRDLAAVGSKDGLYRAVDRDTGETVWSRKISKATGIGGIQAGSAVANGVIFVAGFEGIDDGFSDAQFGTSIDTGLFPNAFFATFSPAFWADVEDVSDDYNPATGMRVKVYALDAATGKSMWLVKGHDYVELLAGAALRHVSIANDLVFVTASSGQLFILDAKNGDVLFDDQSVDLNALFNLGLGKPHHASMNGGTVISDGMVYVPYGAQNNPSGGLIAYELNEAPVAQDDDINIWAAESVIIDALANDTDANGDQLRYRMIAGQEINTDDHQADMIELKFGTVEVFNLGDDSAQPHAAYLRFTPNNKFNQNRNFKYMVEDMAPRRQVNGVLLDELEPTHRPRHAKARISLTKKY